MEERKFTEKVIEEFGGPTKLSEMLSLKPNVVSMWKKRGIPRAWLMYLRERYPTLKAWQLADAASTKDLPN